MSLRITGKQMDIGDSLRARIEDRIGDAAEKYFANGYSGHVTVEKEGSFFIADCVIHLDSGVLLQTSARENDATGAFDSAADKIEKRLRRYKRKLKDHRTDRGSMEAAEVAYSTLSMPGEDQELSEEDAPLVVAESKTTVRTQTVAMAVMQLEMMDNPVNVFRNAGSGEINIVYRRADGNIGWVDPSTVAG